MLHGLVTSEDGGFHVFDGSQLNCKMTIAHMAVNRPFQSGTSVHTGFKSQHWDAIATHNINRQIQRGTSVHPMPNAQYESLACRMLFRLVAKNPATGLCLCLIRAVNTSPSYVPTPIQVWRVSNLRVWNAPSKHLPSWCCQPKHCNLERIRTC